MPVSVRACQADKAPLEVVCILKALAESIPTVLFEVHKTNLDAPGSGGCKAFGGEPTRGTPYLGTDLRPLLKAVVAPTRKAVRTQRV